jgi:hypothetical protein
VVKPSSRRLLDPQGIAKQPDAKSEGKYNNAIYNCEDDPRLKVADLAGQLLPSLPHALKVSPEALEHFILRN